MHTVKGQNEMRTLTKDRPLRADDIIIRRRGLVPTRYQVLPETTEVGNIKLRRHDDGLVLEVWWAYESDLPRGFALEQPDDAEGLVRYYWKHRSPAPKPGAVITLHGGKLARVVAAHAPVGMVERRRLVLELMELPTTTLEPHGR